MCLKFSRKKIIIIIIKRFKIALITLITLPLLLNGIVSKLTQILPISLWHAFVLLLITQFPGLEKIKNLINEFSS